MNSIQFESPKKEGAGEDSYFFLQLSQPGYSIPFDLEWSVENGLLPNLKVQKQITELRVHILNQLVNNRTLFRSPPTFASIEAITPIWGILVGRSNVLQWASTDIWDYTYTPEKRIQQNAIVRLVLTGLRISRSRIVPVWELSVTQILPDSSKDGVIDFDFDDVKERRDSVEEVESIPAMDEEEGTIVQLQDPTERKRKVKEHVHALRIAAQTARHAFDDAVDEFYDEFDLSEDESDFSDEELDEDSDTP